MISKTFAVKFETLRTAIFRAIKQRVVIISSGNWRNCPYSLRNSPEERSSQLIRGGRLKSLQNTEMLVSRMAKH